MAWLAQNKTAFEKETRVCRFCHKEYGANRGWQQFCSRECQQNYHHLGREQRLKNSAPYKLRFSILARDGFRCRYCGCSAQEDGVRLVVDHIIALEKGGTDAPSNLISACTDCNVGKSDLLLLAAKGQIPSYLTIESLTSIPISKNSKKVT